MTHTDAHTDANAARDGRDQIVRFAFGGMAAQTVRAAVGLRIVELLGDRRRTAADVAADAGTDAPTTNRLLRALTALGLLAEHDPGTFSVTPAGALLDPGHPDSMAAFIRMFTDPAILASWERLDASVRTGEIAFDAVFGTDFFGYLAGRPDLAAVFHAAMSQSAAQFAAVLPHAYDFGRFTAVTDVGGGSGTLLAAVLDAYPDLTGVVFDTAEGLATTPETLARHGLTGRCATAEGDFFRSVPAGSDLYLMKSVLHDWPDDRAAAILGHCRAVLPPGGRVLIVEPVLPETATADGTAATYLSDLNMLVNLGGRERTRADFAELCGRAGLALTSVTPVPRAGIYALIEAAAA